MSLQSVKENLFFIKDKINKLNRGKIELVGVVKYQPLEKVIEAVNEEIDFLGVNYVQEGDELKNKIRNEKQKWTFIGHIQSRKAVDLVGYHWVESIDRIEVAKKLNQKLTELGKTLSVLIELNIGAEKNKSGISMSELDAFILQMKKFTRILVKGLMVMPPPLQPIELRRPYFALAYDQFKSRSGNEGWDVLSMGTSEDFLIAIEEGATRVRLGTALFGERRVVSDR